MPDTSLRGDSEPTLAGYDSHELQNLTISITTLRVWDARRLRLAAPPVSGAGCFAFGDLELMF